MTSQSLGMRSKSSSKNTTEFPSVHHIKVGPQFATFVRSVVGRYLVASVTTFLPSFLFILSFRSRDASNAKGGVRTFGHDLELPHCVVKAATKCRYLESWDYMVISDSVA